eukprot:CAMPEP_0171979190 /NCGR_PEP_ID=MMETSP0993-20121228/255793_1 /TAXON_ID=483369 /ORGANISM="non described non described, Strain CCMP2098" /LENGTH=31 /DNA_ID= /DNA_START= /DNA_END= /DNA_ORIENTATION=
MWYVVVTAMLTGLRTSHPSERGATPRYMAIV